MHMALRSRSRMPCLVLPSDAPAPARAWNPYVSTLVTRWRCRGWWSAVSISDDTGRARTNAAHLPPFQVASTPAGLAHDELPRPSHLDPARPPPPARRLLTHPLLSPQH